MRTFNLHTCTQLLDRNRALAINIYTMSYTPVDKRQMRTEKKSAAAQLSLGEVEKLKSVDMFLTEYKKNFYNLLIFDNFHSDVLKKNA